MTEPMAQIDPDRDTLLNAAVLRWMQELAPQGILLTDSALNVVGWNRWLEERSGRRFKDVLGKNLLELYPDLIERGLDASYKDALSTNQAEIFSLPEETIICPGHGPMTTLAEERKHNPFFAAA